MEKPSIYRRYNLPITLASFIFLQYFFRHYDELQYAPIWKSWLFVLLAFFTGCAVLDFINRARFGYIEDEKEKHASWVLKQMKLPLDEALDDMVNNSAHLDISGRHLQPYYNKLKRLSETMGKNILD